MDGAEAPVALVAVWDALPEAAEPLVLKAGDLARFVFSEMRPDEELVPIQTFVQDYRGRRAFSNEMVTSPGARLAFIADPTMRSARD